MSLQHKGIKVTGQHDVKFKFHNENLKNNVTTRNGNQVQIDKKMMSFEKKETTKILVEKTEIRKIENAVKNAAPKQVSAPKPKSTQKIGSTPKPKAAAPKPSTNQTPKQASAPRSTQKSAPTQANVILVAINPKISNFYTNQAPKSAPNQKVSAPKTAQSSTPKQHAPAARPARTVVKK